MNIESPVRKSYTFTQHLSDVPEVVFPLLCPVEEEKWVPGWNPLFVYSESGCIEKHCVFVTENDGKNAVWLVVRHEPDNFFLEMVKFIPEHTVGRLEIQLRDGNEGRTRADIMFEYTAVGPDGIKFLDEFTEEYFLDFMRRWEKSMNFYLEHGEKIVF